MLYLDLLTFAYSILPAVLFILITSLICKKRTIVSATPYNKSRITSEDLESCEWLTAILDRAFEGIVADAGDSIKSSIENRVVHFITSKGYLREAKFHMESLGKSPPKLAVINMIRRRRRRSGLFADMELKGGEIDESVRKSRVTNDNNNKITSDKSCTREANVLEFECEVEYSGGMCASLAAKIPVVKDRVLPFNVRCSELSFSAHMWLRLTCSDGSCAEEKLNSVHNDCSNNDNNSDSNITYDSNNNDSNNNNNGGRITHSTTISRPMLTVEVNCVSDPFYSFELGTEIGFKYVLKDLMFVNYILQSILNMMLQKYVVRPANPILFVFPLPYISESSSSVHSSTDESL